MKLPRFSRHLHVSLRIGALVLAALVLFGLTALVCAALISRVAGSRAGALLGILCGLVVWLFIAVFHFRRERAILPCDDRAGLLRQLRAELSDLGYETGGDAGGSCTYRPGFLSLLVGGSVRVDLAEGCVTVTGPKLCVERVRRRLRLHNHIRNARTPAPALARMPAVTTMVQQGNG